MAAWRATFEPVVSFEYRGLTVCKTQPWAAGPVGLQQLALLQGFDLAELSTAELVHVVVECGKLAFADRDALYGDAEDVPLETLLSAEYNDERRTLVGDDASGDYRPGVGRLPSLRAAEATIGSGEPGRGTVHLDIADRFGNMISATPSGGWLQSSPVIPALGWPLGTRAQMFWLEEGLASSLRPGTRPRTTLCPGLALRDGEPYLAWGTPGWRPAGAVGAPRVRPPRRPRDEPPGGDRRARVPHGPPHLVVLPARLRAEVARARVAVRLTDDPRSAATRTRRLALAGLVGRDASPRSRVSPTGSCAPARIRAACRATRSVGSVRARDRAHSHVLVGRPVRAPRHDGRSLRPRAHADDGARESSAAADRTDARLPSRRGDARARDLRVRAGRVPLQPDRDRPCRARDDAHGLRDGPRLRHDARRAGRLDDARGEGELHARADRRQRASCGAPARSFTRVAGSRRPSRASRMPQGRLCAHGTSTILVLGG